MKGVNSLINRPQPSFLKLTRPIVDTVRRLG